MGTLPFVVQPKLKPVTERYGNEDIGVIEVERRGYLTGGEKAYLQAYDTGDKVPNLILSLVKKVAKSAKMSMPDAHQVVMSGLQASNVPAKHQKILDQYEGDMTEILTAVMSSEQKKSVVRAACMMHYRMGVPFEDTDLVFELHPDLVASLSQLCVDEELKSIDRLQSNLSSENAAAELTAVEELEKK